MVWVMKGVRCSRLGGEIGCWRNKETYGGRFMEAIVLAGGYSSRAKKFKMTLDIGGYTVLEQTISKFEHVCERVIVVCGHRHEEIEALVKGINEKRRYAMEITTVFNGHYSKGMFTSIQAGCKVLQSPSFFMTPGDYPLVRADTIASLAREVGEVIIPSYENHGGHPIRMSEQVREAILRCEPSDNLRLVLNQFDKHYIQVADQGVVMDIDTMEDYRRGIDYYKRL